MAYCRLQENEGEKHSSEVAYSDVAEEGKKRGGVPSIFNHCEEQLVVSPMALRPGGGKKTAEDLGGGEKRFSGMFPTRQGKDPSTQKKGASREID